MRRALWMLALAATVVTAAGGVTPAPAFAGCAELVVWHDTAYSEEWTTAHGPHAAATARLPGVVLPGCNDTGGPTPAPTRVEARRIAGVAPAVALLADQKIFVAAGYFPQLPGFPLVRTGAPVADATRTCTLGPALVLTGSAVPGTGRLNLGHVRSSLPERLFDHMLINLEVDAHTRITGLSRNGLPYIGTGQRVRIAARRCGGSVIARTITPAGPIVPPSTAEDILGTGWRGGDGVIHQLGGTARIVGAIAVLGVLVLVVLGLRAGRRESPANAG
jgi:hypothetical protein